MASERAQSGCLLIADISGYTEYLTGSELDHAQGIIDGLIESILTSIQPHFEIGNLEGDAVFAHAAAGVLPPGQTLLDVIEGAYCDFMGTREHIARNTSCPCQACSNISVLDLKFVAHYGSYVRSRVGDREELSGPDVVLVHRLLKNSIVETLGVSAYAFVSDRCLEALEAGAALEGQPHAESYEHFEPVAGRVVDLSGALERRAPEAIRVEPAQTWFEHGCRTSLPAARVWEHVTEPDRRAVWLESERVTESGGARRGAGTVQHCHHGNFTSNQVILDWEPCRRVTYDAYIPFGGRFRFMATLEPEAGGTRLTTRFTRVQGQNPLHTVFLRGLARVIRLRRNLTRSGELLEAELRAAEARLVGAA